MLLGQLHIYMQKYEFGHSIHTIYKNQVKKDKRPTCKSLNYKTLWSKHRCTFSWPLVRQRFLRYYIKRTRDRWKEIGFNQNWKLFFKGHHEESEFPMAQWVKDTAFALQAWVTIVAQIWSLSLETSTCHWCGQM